MTSNLQFHCFLLTLSCGTVAKQSKPLLLKPAKRYMPFMRALLLTIFLLITNLAFGQKNNSFPLRTYKIDTLIFQKDTSNLFVREIWDTTMVKTYYCSVDSVDKVFRYGFLNLKKGLVREYTVKNIRDVQVYPRPKKYDDYRGPDTQPVTILRLK